MQKWKRDWLFLQTYRVSLVCWVLWDFLFVCLFSPRQPFLLCKICQKWMFNLLPILGNMETLLHFQLMEPTDYLQNQRRTQRNLLHCFSATRHVSNRLFLLKEHGDRCIAWNENRSTLTTLQTGISKSPYAFLGLKSSVFECHTWFQSWTHPTPPV